MDNEVIYNLELIAAREEASLIVKTNNAKQKNRDR